MSEISFNSIRDGVTLALHAAFPAPAEIHGGNVKQGLKAGDFNVVMPGAGHRLEVGRWYKRTPTVDVIYYPRKDSAECYAVADKLTAVLESITTLEGGCGPRYQLHMERHRRGASCAGGLRPPRL